jgi:hypothetical protein
MAYFADDQEVYEYLGRLFTELAGDETLAAALDSADTVVRYDYRSPEAQITVALLEGEPRTVDFGPSELEPELVLSMDADVAHRFWLGKVNITMALARGQIKYTGPMAKLLALSPILGPAQQHYRALLEAAGRGDLLDV